MLDIDGQGFERKMVSVWQLLATDELKVLLGRVSMNQVSVKVISRSGIAGVNRVYEVAIEWEYLQTR